MDPVVHIFGLGIDPALIVFGFGIGVLVGMTGMGGASLMTPMLILIFGITPVTAIGTDIFYAAVTKTVGGYKHLKLGTVHRGIAFWLAVGSVPSALARRLGDRAAPAELRRRSRRGRARDARRRPARGRDHHPAALALPRRRDPGALGDAPLPPPHHRRGRDRRPHRVRHRPHLRGQRDADRDRADRDLPADAAAGRRHGRLPRRRPALGGGNRPLGRRQRRLPARRDDPASARSPASSSAPTSR